MSVAAGACLRTLAGAAGRLLALPALATETEAAAEAVTQPGVLRIVTWNVWFSPRQAEERMAALFSQALATAPDVLCLQEVLPELAAAVRSHDALNRLYAVSPNDVGVYGCLILARRSLGVAFSEVGLPTQQGRSLVFAHWTDGSVKTAVATVHLESLNNQPTRRAQLEVAASVLAPYPRAVLCGDFNFDARQAWGDWRRSERPRPPPLPAHEPGALAPPPLPPAEESTPAALENSVLHELLPAFTDSWVALRAGSHEDYYTFDGAHNPHVNDEGERMRYDRVMCKGLAPSQFALLGTPAQGTVVPSDHYGVCVEARWDDVASAAEVREARTETEPVL